MVATAHLAAGPQSGAGPLSAQRPGVHRLREAGRPARQPRLSFDAVIDCSDALDLPALPLDLVEPGSAETGITEKVVGALAAAPGRGRYRREDSPPRVHWPQLGECSCPRIVP
jgi:hypothetical protein